MLQVAPGGSRCLCVRVYVRMRLRLYVAWSGEMKEGNHMSNVHAYLQDDYDLVDGSR